MNKVQAIFDEYVQNLYEVEYVDRKGGKNKKYLAHRLIIEAKDIPALEEKLAPVFGKGVYKPKKFRKATIADIPYYIFNDQTLYYGRGAEGGNAFAYTVQIFPWQPLDERQKEKLRNYFPKEPVTVVFSKIMV